MIDYDKMAAAIRELLRADISCTEEEDGTFSSEIYADYRDTMSNDTAAKILKDSDPIQAFWDTLTEWYMESELYYRGELEKNLITALTDADGLFPDGMTDEEESQLRDIVMELVSYRYPEDHYLDQQFYVNILIDTGDGDHDFILNDVKPAYCFYYGEPLNNKASIVWLSKTQGYTKSQLRKALEAGDMRGPAGFLETMRVEVANVSTHMNALTFLVQLSFRELIDLNKLIQYSKSGKSTNAKRGGYITLGKGTGTGLYDPWNGGGSCFGIELECDIKLPIRYIRSALPDGGDGYSIEQCYGMCGSVWARGSVAGIHLPPKLRSA